MTVVKFQRLGRIVIDPLLPDTVVSHVDTVRLVFHLFVTCEDRFVQDACRIGEQFACHIVGYPVPALDQVYILYHTLFSVEDDRRGGRPPNLIAFE